MRRFRTIVLAGILATILTALAGISPSASAQTVRDAGYAALAHIKEDGTIQDASYKIIGHIKPDGTVQDASYKTIGHASGIPQPWAAYYFFFRDAS